MISLIQDLQLDYCVGSAARFILESREGNELESLETAKVYLDRAIAARQVA